MKVISFCLYGNNPKYTVGAVRNAQIAQVLYPGWTCVFYVDEDTNQEILNRLRDESAFVFFGDKNLRNRMLWRLTPTKDYTIEKVIFRDCDSRMSLRELAAVKEWELSGKSVHIMRDHPFHGVPILGGMWGIIPSCLPNLYDLALKADIPDIHGKDQDFLATVHPLFKDDILVHDEIFQKFSFPTKRIGYEFVGSTWNGEDKLDPYPDPDLVKFLEGKV